MQISLQKKILSLGIIILLGLTAVPLVSSLPVEIPSSFTSRSRGFHFDLGDPNGDNGWFVSNVVITITDDNVSFPVRLYYKLHDGDVWSEYTGPITVSSDGYYTASGFAIDQNGTVYNLDPVPFKIDTTAPIFIGFSATPLNCCRTKWLLNATVTDATSGVAKVEFYIDDEFVGNATAYPDSLVFHGKGKKADGIVYDNAGNSAMTVQVTQYIPTMNNLRILMVLLIQLFLKMIGLRDQLGR